jgi:F-type H+-transporting ATPase subunit epsilon
MAAKLKLTVVTPERQIVDAAASEVQLPGELGYLGILPGHAALVTLLKAGVLTYRDAGSSRSLALAGGFAEVSNDVVSVLADLAEEPADVDAAAAERDREAAAEEMKTAGAAAVDEARTRLEFAQARLDILKK